MPNTGGRTEYWCFCTKYMPHITLNSLDTTQCFPFFAYSEEGSNRRENITDWALSEFRSQYKDSSITKWSIFYYVYAVLYHPVYRTRYAANLKRELSRIPFAPEFHSFAKAGKRLAEFHVDYEKQSEYPLEMIENPTRRSTGKLKRCASRKTKRKSSITIF